MNVLRGRWTPEDREAELNRLVDVEVPGDAAGLSVTLAYDRSTGAVIDLGAWGPGGFRGWSGSDKEGFAIGPDVATPSYLPGPVAGEWRILHGLHRVPREGVEWEMRIGFGPADVPPMPPPPPLPERPPRRELPAEPGRRWLAGDLHAHTVHSDGILTVHGLACLARERGLDFIAVTDHNTTSHHPELPAASAYADTILIPGFEITTDRGHSNCFGADRFIDFRNPPDQWLADAEAAGALLSLNHPLAGDTRWRLPMDGRPPLLEVWHSTWDRRGPEPLDWWREWAAGIPIGGSDFHLPGHGGLPGAPTTWVEVEGDDVLGGVRAGRTAISYDPQGPVIVRNDGELVVVDGDGTWLVGPDGDRRRVTGDRVRIPGDAGPWLLVDDDRTALALTL
ncbi:MAG TPA: CehA/McbA family metallohydrolase [Gaiellaceae bacterium]|nr:CehA/McbA family metallohydrolase [Gaiellaceae bacterium]